MFLKTSEVTSLFQGIPTKLQLQEWKVGAWKREEAMKMKKCIILTSLSKLIFQVMLSKMR